MAIFRIQGDNEKKRGIYFEYDSSETPLGEGGMGKVYRGWLCSETTSQRREVAIKFLYGDLPSHVIARARREAAVQLKNDGLIEMIGFTEIRASDEIGQPILRYHVISEYLHGVTLDKVLNGIVTDSNGQVIPFAQELHGKYLNNPYQFAIIIVRSILSGLMALHDAGYIHRDIDPSNIMITSDGKIKLIDFGIAKKINGNNTKESSYTIEGQFIGKPKYAAPELVRGLVDSQNTSTDIYAVGILLYQLLLGKVPFDGEMAEVLDMQLNKKLPLHNIKQKQIRDVIRTATKKKRFQRYQSAAEFRVAVDKLIPLDYPGRSIDWKKIGVFSGGTAVFVGIICSLINVINWKNENPNDDITSDSYLSEMPIENKDANAPDPSSYVLALSLLSDQNTAQEGLTLLKELSNTRDYDATYLLSRLYFDSPESINIGDFSDSIAKFRHNLAIAAQNDKAHRLLKTAIDINPNDYRSLFELGCDYKSRRRGAIPNRDSAIMYLRKAMELAAQAEDKEYLQAISDRLENL